MNIYGFGWMWMYVTLMNMDMDLIKSVLKNLIFLHTARKVRTVRPAGEKQPIRILRSSWRKLVYAPR